jgi:hypothetical protein
MNDDFISSSMETGMRVPGDVGPAGGGGVVGGGELPSVVSMRWPRNLSRRAGQVTACEIFDGESRDPSDSEPAIERVQESLENNFCVLRYTRDTRFRDPPTDLARGHTWSAEATYISVQKQAQIA